MHMAEIGSGTEMRMKKRNWLIKITAMGLCMAVLFGSTVTAEAAERKSPEDAYRAVFDAEYYYNTYPDLQAAIGNDEEALFAHFVNNGIREGRSGVPDFNLRAYIQHNADLMSAYGEDFAAYCEHYVNSGKAEGRLALADENSDPGLGSYSSTYDVNEQRAINVELAAQRINGIVLQPGEEFSFSDRILSRTYENGYVLGPSYAAGRAVVSVGGGICQVSSTLYVAMIRAVLPSTERWTHSAPVDYVPQGVDATIAEGSKDLKFKNIYAKPLVISATTENGLLTVTLDFAQDA